MSEIGLKRTDLWNNDSIAGNKRFDGISSGARRVATGDDVRGTDRDRAVEALRGREVERTRTGSGAINLTSRFSAGGLGREGDDAGQSFKVKGITAMFCSLTQSKAESAATDINVSWLVKKESCGGGKMCGHDEPPATGFATNSEHSRQLYFLRSRCIVGSKPVREFVLRRAPFSLRELHIGSQGIRIGSARVAHEASGARAGRGLRARSEAVLHTDAVQFGKQAT
jgi:hypothetical protein